MSAAAFDGEAGVPRGDTLEGMEQSTEKGFEEMYTAMVNAVSTIQDGVDAKLDTDDKNLVLKMKDEARAALRDTKHAMAIVVGFTGTQSEARSSLHAFLKQRATAADSKRWSALSDETLAFLETSRTAGGLETAKAMDASMEQWAKVLMSQEALAKSLATKKTKCEEFQKKLQSSIKWLKRYQIVATGMLFVIGVPIAAILGSGCVTFTLGGLLGVHAVSFLGIWFLERQQRYWGDKVASKEREMAEQAAKHEHLELVTEKVKILGDRLKEEMDFEMDLHDNLVYSRHADLEIREEGLAGAGAAQQARAFWKDIRKNCRNKDDLNEWHAIVGELTDKTEVLGFILADSLRFDDLGRRIVDWARKLEGLKTCIEAVASQQADAVAP